MNSKNALFAALALAAATSFAAEKTPPKMETRLYREQLGFAKESSGGGGGTFGKMISMDAGEDLPAILPLSEKSHRDTDLMKILSSYGILFPEGAFAGLDRRLNGLVMRNTVENHTRFRRWLGLVSPKPTQVELDFAVITFAPADIEVLARKSPAASFLQDELMALWKAGKGKLEAKQKLKTRSGVNAQMQAVEEIMYPTEFMQAVSPTFTNRPAQDAVITPGSFETRECGLIVNFTPTVQPDNKTIDLVLAPEITPCDGVMDDVSVKSGTQEVKVQQPRFSSGKTTTTIVVRDGETHVMGGMANRANDGWRYFFITARLVDAAGGKPGETDDSILLDDGSATTAK